MARATNDTVLTFNKLAVEGVLSAHIMFDELFFNATCIPANKNGRQIKVATTETYFGRFGILDFSVFGTRFTTNILGISGLSEYADLKIKIAYSFDPDKDNANLDVFVSSDGNSEIDVVRMREYYTWNAHWRVTHQMNPKEFAAFLKSF